MRETTGSPVEAVLRACSLLRAFRAEGELLGRRDLTARTGLSKATAFRVLNTLVLAAWWNEWAIASIAAA